jgi:hypothetical protein
MAKKKKVRMIEAWMRDHPDDVPCHETRQRPAPGEPSVAWKRARRLRFCAPASVPQVIRGFKRKSINWKASLERPRAAPLRGEAHLNWWELN